MRVAPASAALLLGLLFLAPPLLAAQGGMEGSAPGRDRGMMKAGDRQAQDHAAMWQNLTEGQRAAGLGRAEQARLFASFQPANGEARGRFVSFNYDVRTGDLFEYAAGDATVNTTFFARVHPSPWAANGTEAAQGAVFRLAGGNTSIMAHNNPSAVLAVRGAGLTVSFRLNPTVSPEGNLTAGQRSIRLLAPNGHGHLFLAGNGTLALVGSEFEAVLADGAVMFVAHPGNTTHGALLHERIAAATAGTLGGEATVVEGSGAAVADAESYGVTMRADRAGSGKVSLRVASDDPRGRAVVVRTDTATVPAGKPEEVRVLLDGVALGAAPATDVLNGTAAGKANVTIAAGSIQVVVGVGGFSEHTLEVQTAPAATPPPAPPTPPPTTPPPTTPPPSPPPAQSTPGFEAALAVLAVAVLALRRRGA